MTILNSLEEAVLIVDKDNLEYSNLQHNFLYKVFSEHLQPNENMMHAKQLKPITYEETVSPVCWNRYFSIAEIVTEQYPIFFATNRFMLRNPRRDLTEPTRVISFSKKEIDYNYKKCMLIVITDVTDQHAMSKLQFRTEDLRRKIV